VKAFRILPKALDPEEDGEPVTPTRKLKRSLMLERFVDLVESMYDDREERLVTAGAGDVLAGGRTSTTPRGRGAGKRGHFRAAVVATGALLLPVPGGAQDAYVVGISAAMTGPSAVNYAPIVEGLQLYLEHLNAKGGINGKPVRLLVQDDQGEPSRAAANAKK